MQAEEEEVHLVREFRERLRYNLQQVSFGASVVLDGVIQLCHQAWHLLHHDCDPARLFGAINASR